MSIRYVSTAFILFGVLELSISLPFPDVILALVHANPPGWISLLTKSLLPVLCIVFGIVMFIRRRIGAVLLAITSALYTLIFIWGASGLGYWGLLSIGDFRAPGAIDYSVIGGAVLFTAATVYLGIQGIKRD